MEQVRNYQHRVQVLESLVLKMIHLYPEQNIHSLKEVFSPVNSLISEERKNENTRELLVEVMCFSIEYWEISTKETKIELAEKSQIWNVRIESGSYTTRTLNKYLNLHTLPKKKPRVQDVIRTGNYVLRHCPPLLHKKEELACVVNRLKDLSRTMKIQ